MKTIGFIGAGNMAEAFIRGIVESGLYQVESIIAADVLPDRLEYLAGKYGIRVTADNIELVTKSQTVFLSVKPQNMDAALSGIAGKLRDDVLVISIAAGITTSFITARLGEIPVIRTMPNTPAMIGEGVTAIYNLNADPASLAETLKLFEVVGKAVTLDDEGLIDAVTALSGSGPAYFFLLVEEMVNAAVKLGIPRDKALTLACGTAKGAGYLAAAGLAEGEEPEELRKKVTSKGGTTAAALAIFEELNFGESVYQAIKAARNRSVELSGPA